MIVSVRIVPNVDSQQKHFSIEEWSLSMGEWLFDQESERPAQLCPTLLLPKRCGPLSAGCLTA